MNIVIEEFLDMVLENWEDFNDGGLNENEILLKKGVWNIIENGTKDFTWKEGTSLKMEQTKLCACVRYSNSFSFFFFALFLSHEQCHTIIVEWFIFAINFFPLYYFMAFHMRAKKKRNCKEEMEKSSNCNPTEKEIPRNSSVS